MNPYRSTLRLRLLAGAVLCCVGTPAVSQDYPARPLRVVVPWPAGGSSDTLARLVGPKLAERWGQAVVVENRPGAGTTIGNEIVSKAAPDGYTLLVTATAFVISSVLHKQVAYNAQKDFTGVTLAATAPSVLVVHPSLGVRTVRELISLAKARPGEINYASGGAGSSDHIAAELFKTLTGSKLTHIPYKGGGPAVADLVAGNVQMMFSIIITALPHVRSGRLTALAVTGNERSSLLTQVPTVTEAGVAGYQFDSWIGVLVPNGTPGSLIEKLNREIVGALNSTDVRERLRGMGAQPVASTADYFNQKIQSDFVTVRKIVEASGMKVE